MQLSAYIANGCIHVKDRGRSPIGHDHSRVIAENDMRAIEAPR